MPTQRSQDRYDEQASSRDVHHGCGRTQILTAFPTLASGRVIVTLTGGGAVVSRTVVVGVVVTSIRVAVVIRIGYIGVGASGSIVVVALIIDPR